MRSLIDNRIALTLRRTELRNRIAGMASKIESIRDRVLEIDSFEPSDALSDERDRASSKMRYIRSEMLDEQTDLNLVEGELDNNMSHIIAEFLMVDYV